MKADKAAAELAVIRQLMERPIRLSTMSGLSAILAGCAALVGVAVDWHVSQTNAPATAMWINMAVWGGVFVVAFTGVMVLTRIRERKQGMPFWSNVKRRIGMTILPCIVAGMGLTLAIVYRWHDAIGPNQWGLIPAVWMLFYGVALWQLGDLSIVEVRLMGAAFILAGLLSAAAFQMRPYWCIGLTFGGFHIVYGTVVWFRHGG